MIGGRVDFSCDDGQIFDQDRIECRNGDNETCTFSAIEIPDNECENDFLRLGPHPDPDLCWWFFACLNYNTIVFRCEYGEIYSAERERCVPGSHHTCQEGDLSPFNKMN